MKRLFSVLALTFLLPAGPARADLDAATAVATLATLGFGGLAVYNATNLCAKILTGPLPGAIRNMLAARSATRDFGRGAGARAAADRKRAAIYDQWRLRLRQAGPLLADMDLRMTENPQADAETSDVRDYRRRLAGTDPATLGSWLSLNASDLERSARSFAAALNGAYAGPVLLTPDQWPLRIVPVDPDGGEFAEGLKLGLYVDPLPVDAGHLDFARGLYVLLIGERRDVNLGTRTLVSPDALAPQLERWQKSWRQDNPESVVEFTFRPGPVGHTAGMFGELSYPLKVTAQNSASALEAARAHLYLLQNLALWVKASGAGYRTRAATEERDRARALGNRPI